jgi:nucleotide-binding universal stress UspA family protein
MARGSVVVGVDGSPESGRAVELAWKIAQAARADLVPVHAVPDLWLAGGLERSLVDVHAVLPTVARGHAFR